MTQSQDSIPFEQALSEIERLIERIQGDALNLDALLQMHARAIHLLRLCRGQLDLASTQIERQSALLLAGADAAQ